MSAIFLQFDIAGVFFYLCIFASGGRTKFADLFLESYTLKKGHMYLIYAGMTAAFFLVGSQHWRISPFTRIRQNWSTSYYFLQKKTQFPFSEIPIFWNCLCKLYSVFCSFLWRKFYTSCFECMLSVTKSISLFQICPICCVKIIECTQNILLLLQLERLFLMKQQNLKSFSPQAQLVL